jgi:aminomethyltransferase
VENVSAGYAQLALQGPAAAAILDRVSAAEASPLGGYRFTEGTVAGHRAIISRTGYTGEDGFELYLAPEAAEPVWLALMEEGKRAGLVPCGLGARDTLRLEARMPLYGNDIDDTVTPLEAGLGFIVRLEKGPFLGREILQRQRTAGVTKKLVGFEMVDRGIPRHGYPLRVAGRDSGAVTSGTFAPFLRKSIGLGYVPAEHSAVGQEIQVVIRGAEVPGRIVKTPFYKRPS